MKLVTLTRNSSGLVFAGALLLSVSAWVNGQVIVQPGAPGQETKILPSTTRPVLTQLSRKDVEFMQGMIHHHAQAIEMVALFEGRTTNRDLRLLGARISHTQADEMRFMEQWLAARRQSTNMPMPAATSRHPGMSMPAHEMLMPGMLTRTQMTALANAKGKEFDRLFLEGMIQHHAGALTMIKQLFETSGAGQDADLFNFATDIDSGQRAEIRIMQGMLQKL